MKNCLTLKGLRTQKKKKLILEKVLDTKKYTLCLLQHNPHFKCEVEITSYPSHCTYLLKSSENGLKQQDPNVMDSSA